MMVTLIISVTLVTSLVYFVGVDPPRQEDSSSPQTFAESTPAATAQTPSLAPNPDSASDASTATDNGSTPNATTAPQHSHGDVYATIEIQTPIYTGANAGSLALDVTIEYYVYERSTQSVLIPYQNFTCIYSVDNGEWKETFLRANVSQSWCMSLVNGGGWNEVFCSYSAVVQGLSDGLHLINVTVTPSEVWSHDYYSLGTDSSIYFAVHGQSVFSCRLKHPWNVTGGNPNVFLEPVLNAPSSWMAYSLDGQANVTITGETKMPGVTNGCHSVTVYANDTCGAMTRSNTVFFSVDS
jgi:hypothetical protein